MRATGFTLVEALIASVILAAGMLAVASVVNASYALTRQLREDATAHALARQLMEEIAARPFTAAQAPAGITQLAAVAGWPTNTNRATYDDMFDFNGYTDTTAGIKAGGSTAVTLSAPGTYKRVVSVTAATSSSFTTVPGDTAVVNVTVTEPSGKQISLSRLVTSTFAGRAQAVGS